MWAVTPTQKGSCVSQILIIATSIYPKEFSEIKHKLNPSRILSRQLKAQMIYSVMQYSWVCLPNNKTNENNKQQILVAARRAHLSSEQTQGI